MPSERIEVELIYASATLTAALGTMSTKKREVALEAFDHWVAECKRIDKEADPLSLAYSLHESIDSHVQHMRATSRHASSITCRKGCAACCCMYAGVFPHEARLLRSYAGELGVEIDEARLARQAQKTEVTWMELSPEDRRCVFLDDANACQVYEHRPSGCRKYHVKSDPELCDAAKHPGGEVSVVFSLEAELLHSAAMTTFVQGSDNMAAVLLAVKDEK